ncbi:hypothetical protein BLOT_001649 [Blomia tropicalis]|nr:hypothetical protein BLOT_001649 [Blomia tropicalis]
MSSRVLNKRDDDQLEYIFELAYQEILQATKTTPLKQSKTGNLTEVDDWLKNVIEYNLKNGKRNRAKFLVIAYELFINKPVSDSDIQKACILGWCVEFLQTYFLILDDIMDNSVTRRGQLCWYRKESVGLTAINDAVMLNNCIYQLLHDYFSTHQSYQLIVDLFNEITRYTTYGQCLDLISNPLGIKPDLSKYNEERYRTIVLNKTSYYSFCLPIRIAMYMSNITDETSHRKVEQILLKIGYLFQAQDDYLDCYGDPKITGKIGTDIEDAKCSWLVVQALQLANVKQREIIDLNYGQQKEESVQSIKSVYNELDIAEIFKQFEAKQYEEICGQIEKIDDPNLSKDLFYGILAKIYQRNK